MYSCIPPCHNNPSFQPAIVHKFGRRSIWKKLPSAETEFLLLQAAHDIFLEAKVRKLKHCVTLMIYQSFCKLANFSSKGYHNGKRADVIYYIKKGFKHTAILQPNQTKPKFDQVFFIYKYNHCDVRRVCVMWKRLRVLRKGCMIFWTVVDLVKIVNAWFCSAFLHNG